MKSSAKEGCIQIFKDSSTTAVTKWKLHLISLHKLEEWGNLEGKHFFCLFWLSPFPPWLHTPPSWHTQYLAHFRPTPPCCVHTEWMAPLYSYASESAQIFCFNLCKWKQSKKNCWWLSNAPSTHWVNFRLFTIPALSIAIETPSGARTVHVKKKKLLNLECWIFYIRRPFSETWMW